MKYKDTKHDAKDPADVTHSGTADKVKGHIKEAVGTAKEKVGGVIGSGHIAAEGHRQHAEGKKDVLKGEIKEKVEDIKGKAKAGAEVIADKVRGAGR